MKNITGPKFILLIDDDEATNFIHEIVIKSSGIKTKFQSVNTGKKAIQVLKEIDKSIPENGEGKEGIVFLDLNMPAMNGWEFLQEYKMLQLVKKDRLLLVVLTTSMNPDDKEKAESSGVIDLFLVKPLTKEILADINKAYFV